MSGARGIPFLPLALLLALAPGALGAQERPSEREILESQRRLDEIRQERLQLQTEMNQLRSQAQGASSQLQNIERQVSASKSVLAELDYQIQARSQAVEETSIQLVAAQEDLERSRSTFRSRLRSIYKRGPLHTVRVLLSADSFANLLTRYRYLRLVAEQDRTTLTRVADLERDLTLNNRELQESLAEMHRLREEQATEVSALQRVESQRQAALARYRTQVAETESRLGTLAETEQRLSGVIGDIEDRRVQSESSGNSANRAPLRVAESGSDSEAAPDSGAGGGGAGVDPVAGTLSWPVRGEIVYPFGRQRKPNGTVLRWNGVGIGAPLGTPVRAVLAGSVALAGPFEGYGPTVILSHGEGLYTLYLYLGDVAVVQGRYVGEGDVLGTVGGAETPEGPHLEFQIRGPVEGSAPSAMDPMSWLQPPGGP
ncbi:MAG: murein hydrolase activator EnvC family protein [Longimicrobiales bacterium]